MSCCGLNRILAVTPAFPTGSTAPSGIAGDIPTRTATRAQRGDIPLRYREHARILVRGPVTGRSYVFSATQPTQPVNPHDAVHLLRSRYFVRG